MSVICPTVLASDEVDFKRQIDKLQPFAERIQIDLSDGDFAPGQTIDLSDVWWPYSVQADLHLMYQRPMDYLHEITRLRPHLVIVHAEADVHHMHFAAELHKEGIEAGLCVLKDTPIDNVKQILHSFDHLLIFSGDLGHFGGQADLGLLEKVKQAKAHHLELEIGWDGGINDQNARDLQAGGVDVLNVGGFIQRSDDPEGSFNKLRSIIT